MGSGRAAGVGLLAALRARALPRDTARVAVRLDDMALRARPPTQHAQLGSRHFVRAPSYGAWPMAATIGFATMTEQIAAASRTVRDAKEAWDDAREARDRLIVEASDEGMPQRAIAKAAGLSQPRIIALLVTQTGFVEN